MPLLLVAAAGCGQGSNSTVCTTSFAFLSAVPVDTNGQPVTAAFVVTDTVLRTGQVLSIAQQGYPAGAVTVFSDNNVHDVRQAGDSVRVAGTGAGKTFSAVYQFGTDGCHIRRIAGPDSVVVR